MALVKCHVSRVMLECLFIENVFPLGFFIRETLLVKGFSGIVCLLSILFWFQAQRPRKYKRGNVWTLTQKSVITCKCSWASTMHHYFGKWKLSKIQNKIVLTLVKENQNWFFLYILLLYSVDSCSRITNKIVATGQSEAALRFQNHGRFF